MEVCGALHGGPWRFPWRSMEPPQTSMETSMNLYRPPRISVETSLEPPRRSKLCKLKVFFFLLFVIE